MLYCDKCKNHIAQRHVNGRGNDMSFGPFAVDLCARCYNEFRTVVADWLNNNVWREVDEQSHSDENSLVRFK